MLDWNTGVPNARFEALRLLIRYAHSGGTMVATRIFPHDHDIDALAFTEEGVHRLLIVNRQTAAFRWKCRRSLSEVPFMLSLPESSQPS